MSRNSKSRELNWDFLSQYFEVDSSSVTGLTWKEREESVGRWNEQYAGGQAGTVFTDEDGRKYCSVMLTVDGVERRISRLSIISLLPSLISTPLDVLLNLGGNDHPWPTN